MLENLQCFMVGQNQFKSACNRPTFALSFDSDNKKGPSVKMI